MNDQDIIQNFYSLLPEKAQAKFSSRTWLRDAASIGLKYGLNDVQVEALKNEVMLVLLAIEDADVLTKNLQRELTLSSDTSLKIAKDIESLILSDVKTELAESFVTTGKGLDEFLAESSSVKLNNHAEEPATLSVLEVSQPTADTPPSNLPVMPEEREVTILKITTNNPVLNKQLQVPITHPLEKTQAPAPVAPLAEKPIPAPMPASQPQTPTIKQDGPSILGARLGGSFNMPQEEVTMAPKRIDPYREPVE